MKQFGERASQGLAVLGLIFLFTLAQHSYLLFYSVINVSCAAIGIAVFLLTFSLRDIISSSFFSIVGLGYGIVAILDLIQILLSQGLTIIIKGSDVFAEYLLSMARLYDAGILFAGIFLCNRLIPFHIILSLHFFVLLIGISSLFLVPVVSDWNPFLFNSVPLKTVVEIIVLPLQLYSIRLLSQNRSQFSPTVFKYLMGTYVVTLLTEFIYFVNPAIYTNISLLGHFSHFTAYLLFGQAFLSHTLREPLNTSVSALNKKNYELESVNTSLSNEIISRTLTEQELQKKNKMLSAFADTLADIMSQSSISELLDLLMARTGQPIGCPNSFIYLVDPKDNTMTMISATGCFQSHVALRLRSGEGLAGKVLQEEKTISLADYSNWSNRMPGEQRDKIKAVVGVPLKTGKRIEAVIGFGYEDAESSFSPVDINFIERIAAVGAIAIERSNLYTKLTSELAERTKAEEDLERSCNYYFSLFEQFPGMIWQALTEDRQGFYFNEHWLNFTGHSFPNELDSGWMQAVHPDDIEALMKLHRSAYATRSGYETQYRLKRADKQYRWIAEVANPLYDFRNHFSGYMGGCFDVTDREELQEVLAERNRELQQALREIRQTQTKLIHQEKLAGIGQLAAGVAHEINNPLAFVNSNIHTLNRYVNSLITLIALGNEAANACAAAEDPACRSAGQRFTDAQKSSSIHTILADYPDLFSETLNGLDRVKSIVVSLRSFSRVDQGSGMEEYDLNAGVVSTLIVAHNEYKYTAIVHKELGEVPKFPANGGQINQVLLNLIVNASQAIRSQNLQEPGVIYVKTFTDMDHAIVEVYNNGPPIPPDIAPHLFEPFFTTKPVGEGTGLGLSISYDIIVNVHKGLISFTSDDTGTIFRVELPLENDSTTPKKPPLNTEPQE